MTSLDWTGNSSVQQVSAGLKALRHRGPDGCRIWRSPSGLVTFGHARLRIIDLSTGDQPIANETGHIHCVVNGEFYDFEQIRTNLESRGHQFTTRSDSEILVHLYEEFGVNCLHHLRGEYAFVLWDEHRQTLFAARDRFGIKPIFISELQGTVLLASEIKALHAAGVSAQWDEQGFFEKLVLHSPIQGRTLFRHVAELPPAHYLIARNGSLTQHAYWDFNYPPEANVQPDRSDDDYAADLFDSLDKAVQTRLRADVPVACYLSGGIDSGSVLAMMSRHVSQPVDAFCLTFDDPAFDEFTAARETAAYVNANLHAVPLTEATLADDLGDAVWHGETVFTNAQCVAKFALSRAVRSAGYSVVLTGEGADEILAGYPTFVVDSARQANPSCLPIHPHRADQPSVFLDRLGYRPAWHEAQDCLLDLLEPVLPSSHGRESTREHFLDSLDLTHQLTGRSVVNQSLYLYNKTALSGHILTVMGDRMEMAHSVEGRPPFLDHHLVEFSRCLPSSLKIRDFAEKFVLRKAMRSFVPPATCGRRKQALQTPPYLLKSGSMNTLLQDTLRGSALDRIPFINKAAALRLLNTASTAEPHTIAQRDSALMILLTAGVLGERFRAN